MVAILWIEVPATIRELFQQFVQVTYYPFNNRVEPGIGRACGGGAAVMAT
jgi:hypothetical protein